MSINKRSKAIGSASLSAGQILLLASSALVVAAIAFGQDSNATFTVDPTIFNGPTQIADAGRGPRPLAAFAGIATSQSLLVVITVWPHSGAFYDLDVVLPPSGSPFSTDFPFASFNKGAGGVGLTQSDVSDIDYIESRLRAAASPVSE